MSADLHIHTTASDGRLSPQEVLLQAKQAGLTHIAITDHDTVDGLGMLAENIWGVNIIPGIELNTDLPDYEVHILGYYIDIHNSHLNHELKKIAKDRVLRARKMVEKLCLLGFPLDYCRIEQFAGDSKSVGRPHVAQALLEKEYFSDMDEIFTTLLDKNGPAYVPHYKLTPEGAIKLIRIAGGIPVVAHPGLVGNDEIIIQLIQAGIRGLEVYHPKHSKEQTEKYLSLASKYGLLVTGGSDFHGIPDRFPERLGLFTIPPMLAVKLGEASRH